MDTSKLNEALEELQQKRSIIDTSIISLKAAIAALNGQPKREQLRLDVQSVAALEQESSYIDDAVTVLRSTGQPMHIEALAKAIATLRGNGGIKRSNVESSVCRHISMQKHKSKLIRVKRGFYGLPAWKQQPREVLHPQPSISAVTQ